MKLLLNNAILALFKLYIIKCARSFQIVRDQIVKLTRYNNLLTMQFRTKSEQITFPI